MSMELMRKRFGISVRNEVGIKEISYIEVCEKDLAFVCVPISAR